jgi:hypothetical protein
VDHRLQVEQVWIQTARFAERTAQTNRFKVWSGSAL